MLIITYSLTFITCSAIFMNILIHCQPLITNIQDLFHNDVKGKKILLQLLHVILATLWVLVLIVRLDGTCFLLQIDTIPLEKKMV